MSKWFEVTVTSVKVYAVEVPDSEGADEATSYAMNEASDISEIECSPEITGYENIDRIKRHADEVLGL
jgi:hypothetical protein